MRRLWFCVLPFLAGSALAYQPLPPGTGTGSDELDVNGKAMSWEDKVVTTQFATPDKRPYKKLQMITLSIASEGHYAGKKRNSSPEVLAQMLREKAASIGADAVIDVRFDQYKGFTTVTGMAIRVNIGGEFGIPIEEQRPFDRPKITIAEETEGQIICDDYLTRSPH